VDVKAAKMGVTQEEIDATISVLNGELVHWVLSAAKQDAFGNWDTALCFLDKAEVVSQKIGVLQTKCDVDISDFVNENTSIVQCDIENDRGIGEWAIPPSARSCGIFKIRGGQLPPPYGEFAIVEFNTNEITEVVTE